MSSSSNDRAGSSIGQQEENQVGDDCSAIDLCGSLDLGKFRVSRLVDVLAITTPIPDHHGNVSNRTPIFHLPMYKLDLFLQHHKRANAEHQEDQCKSESEANECDAKLMSFHCDLADLTDFVTKLKELDNEWRRFSWLTTATSGTT